MPKKDLSNLRGEVATLIQRNLALNSEAKQYWLTQIQDMNEFQLNNCIKALNRSEENLKALIQKELENDKEGKIWAGLQEKKKLLLSRASEKVSEQESREADDLLKTLGS